MSFRTATLYHQHISPIVKNHKLSIALKILQSSPALFFLQILPPNGSHTNYSFFASLRRSDPWSNRQDSWPSPYTIGSLVILKSSWGRVKWFYRQIRYFFFFLSYTAISGRREPRLFNLRERACEDAPEKGCRCDSYRFCGNRIMARGEMSWAFFFFYLVSMYWLFPTWIWHELRFEWFYLIPGNTFYGDFFFNGFTDLYYRVDVRGGLWIP